MGFGTGIIPSGWGFTLQNRGHNFSLQDGHPNALAPGKRPYHTIIPAMITKSRAPQSADDSLRPTVDGPPSVGELYAALGVMGGFMQPQGHMQVVVALSDDGMDPQSALDQARFCIDDGTSGGKVALEEGIHGDVVNALVKMGHDAYPVNGLARSLFGRGQIIQRDALTGVLCGGSDPRADGCAMTL
jgi:gamma-glutamyltranspeptidase/glutathione hydrolase